MTDITKIAADLKRDEGLRLKPYHCSAGKLSIGFGRNLDDVGISEFEAECMLERDIHRAMDGLDAGVSWWRLMPSDWQRGLVNMAFNLGITRLLGFRKMLDALQNGDGQRASMECLSSRYAKQVGQRSERVAALFWTDE